MRSGLSLVGPGLALILSKGAGLAIQHLSLRRAPQPVPDVFGQGIKRP